MEWKDVERRALEDMFYVRQMSDRQIADQFGVSKERVKYRRKKFNVTFQGKMLKQFADNNKDVMRELDEDAKGRLADLEDTDVLAAMLGVYVMGSGPLYRLYEEGRLTREELKAAEDHVSGRLAGILDAIEKKEWFKLELLHDHYRKNMRCLEPAVPDRDELEIVFMNHIE